MSGGLTPRGEETLVRLASWMPFEQARELLQDLVGLQVSKATVRRATLTTGEAQLSVCEGEVERLKQEVPQAPGGADKQVRSRGWSDGAPGGGRVGRSQDTRDGAGHAQQARGGLHAADFLFSRLCEAERFAEAALVETQRRGLERAAAVCAVQDGAEWLQGLVDYHRADAVRILDAGPCRRIRQ